MKKNVIWAGLLMFVMGMASSCTQKQECNHWDMKGVVLTVNDLQTVDWANVAAENGINTIGTHIRPNEVMEFMNSEQGKQFMETCKEKGIHVEHQLHAMGELLPRSLFAEDSTMFRMDENGLRVSDFNCCVHSEKALTIIEENALAVAKVLKPTNHRYYFWMDDGKPTCSCPECSPYSPSEQALIIENRILKKLKTIDPEAMLAHLAYENTLSAPQKVKPEEGIFLEFAPIWRSWDKPISDLSGEPLLENADYMTHGDNLKFLEDNLKVFPVETAVVLEYWLDVSLFSRWKKPAVDLPLNKEVFESDLATYAKYGLKNVTTFAVYMDSTYFKNYPAQSYLKTYGEGFNKVK
jgi:hypothetical protein